MTGEGVLQRSRKEAADTECRSLLALSEACFNEAAGMTADECQNGAMLTQDDLL